MMMMTDAISMSPHCALAGGFCAAFFASCEHGDGMRGCGTMWEYGQWMRKGRG
jgi:hypothetical protein